MLRHKIKQLSLIRFVGLILAALTALGRLEYQLVSRPTNDKLLSPWLVSLGWWVERVFLKFLAAALWPLIKLYLASAWCLSGLVRIIIWPWRLVSAIYSSLTDFRNRPRAGRESELRVKIRQRFSQLKPRPRQVFWRPAAAFAVVLLVIILPVKFYGHYQSWQELKDKIIGVSRAALNDVWSGQESIAKQDLTEANRQFSQASKDFVAAEAELSKVNGFFLSLSALLPNSRARLASESQNILEAARLGAAIAADLTLAMNSLFGQTPDQDIVKALAGFNEYGGSAQIQAEQLVMVLNKINEKVLPEEVQADFVYFRDRSQFLTASLQELVSMSANLRTFLGETYDKRYLLVFQNNTEARASGGFMGSFAIVDFSRGRIKKMTVPGGGTYDSEAGMRRIITSPQPLQLVKSRWYLWDANWWPDWPMSAKKIMWFYEQSDGSSVDGVISLTPDVVMKLLAITGPVVLDDEARTTVTADNFLEVVQAFAEQKADQTNTPKAIIGELMDKLISKISANQDKNDWLKIVGVIEDSLNEKQLLLYFNDATLENKVAELGWDGRIKDASGDYLAVINSNINGGKSDKSIKQTIELTTNILSDSSVVDHLKIIRDHQGRTDEPFSGVRNYNWVRIYVPLGSKLIEADGFKAPSRASFEPVETNSETDPDLVNENEAEIHDPSGTWIYREGDKTVFANWSIVDPGEATVINLSYKLPFKLSSRALAKNWLDKITDAFNPEAEANLYRYSLLAQKQSGANNSEIHYQLEVPSSYEVAWNYPEKGSADYLIQDTDKYWGYVLRDKK